MSERALTERLRADLLVARKARDERAVEALRTALSSLANAEAPDFDAAAHQVGQGELVEHARLQLDEQAERHVLEGEVERRARLLDELEGRVDDGFVSDLRAEMAVLRRYLV